ncbi:MAG: DUF1499 domain-containing protein [Pseudomonadales bacterium]|nr:DUF1499 domain-containing protein [Pseudomonadales bacterium]
MWHPKKTKPILQINAVFCIILLTGCSGSPPMTLGVIDGKLPPCPDKPNCVVSHDYDQEHFIDPLTYNGGFPEAYSGLIESIKQMDRSKIITRNSHYIHAEFTSRLMRYVDDVEFYFDPKDKQVQIRSASRIGHSDMGVNRERIDALRTLFKQKKL